ncbi:hypothetical protein Acor_11920 [Acrocarpospora corrugata]|uniref:Uncharacterized protein n=1 Tax=Acrocarpospora corrugata TaxID=35763 RepID=A0A5M3VSF4_9ACTN|nr:hypothetical protein [Acrocarpospora corrugata]GER99128.1 hypothetical protein Acor_11920 [Acrocarpospora corrugata]
MYITPEEAARSLAQIRETQHRALRSAPPMFPSWYVVAVWVFITGIQFFTEVTPLWVLWIALPVLSIGLVVAVLKFVKEIRNQSVRPHPSVVDPWAWGGFAVWIILTTLGSVGLAVGLKALGFAYPGTVMGITMTVIAVITTPILTRWMSMRTVRRAERTN